MARADIHLLADRGVGVALAGHDIEVVVILQDAMDIDLAKVRLVDGGALRHGQVAVGIVADDRAGLVVLVEADTAIRR